MDPYKKSNKNNSMYMLLLVALVVFLAIKLWGHGFSSPEQSLIRDAVAGKHFSGKVQGFKYDNTRQRIKMAILSDGTTYPIYAPWEPSVIVGDSMVKDKGALKIIVYKLKGGKVVLDYEPLLREPRP